MIDRSEVAAGLPVFQIDGNECGKFQKLRLEVVEDGEVTVVEFDDPRERYIQTRISLRQHQPVSLAT